MELVPQLLYSYLTQVDSSVKLIHVGPAALQLAAADGRYLWMPSLSPDNFDRLLGSVDLFLSANISATTIGRAIASGVPVLVVENSCTATTTAEVRVALGKRLAPEMT
jgi:hypothetical protein